jgi:hypothetical protein
MNETVPIKKFVHNGKVYQIRGQKDENRIITRVAIFHQDNNLREILILYGNQNDSASSGQMHLPLAISVLEDEAKSGQFSN